MQGLAVLCLAETIRELVFSLPIMLLTIVVTATTLGEFGMESLDPKLRLVSIPGF